MLRSWTGQVEILRKVVEGECPARALLQNGRVLTDPSLRAILSAATVELHASKLLGQLSEVVTHLKAVEDTLPELKWSSAGPLCQP